jgi:hypothetical protein
MELIQSSMTVSAFLATLYSANHKHLFCLATFEADCGALIIIPAFSIINFVFRMFHLTLTSTQRYLSTLDQYSPGS